MVQIADAPVAGGGGGCADAGAAGAAGAAVSCGVAVAATENICNVHHQCYHYRMSRREG